MKDNIQTINENLYNANITLVDKNKELKNIIKIVYNFILDQSIEYKPGYRKVDLNTKDCIKLLDILDGEIYE